MNERAQGLRRSVLRITFGVGLVLAAAYLIFAAWHPGADIRDGRHDLGSNAIWIAQGWLGADEWLI